MSSGRERARERDFERFLTFVDAVVAISVAIPATSYWPLLLLLVADPIVARVRA